MKLKKTHDTFSEKSESPPVCESCGDEFTCGALLNSCWCMEIKLTDENRADLKTKFKNCLCKKCLQNYNS